MLDAALALEPYAGERARGRARLARSILLRALSMHESVADADAALELSTAAGDLEGRCLALNMVAAHAAYFSDFDRAQAVAREQRVLAERLGDPYLVAVAAMRQGWSAGTTGECRAFADEAVPKLRRCGHLQGIVELTAGMMGRALLDADDEAAVFAADEGLRAAEELGDPMSLAFACGNAGLAALFQSRMDAAERLFGQQIEIFRRERIDGLWDEPATGLACVAAHAGHDERAATFIGFGEAMPALPLTSNDALVRERLLARFVAPARAALGERAWQRVAAAGRAMTPDELCRFALDAEATVARDAAA